MKQQDLPSYEVHLGGSRQKSYNLSNAYRTSEKEPLTVEYTIGKTFCSSEYHCRFSPSKHNCFMFFQKGCGTLIYDGTVYYPKTGDFFLLHAGHNWEFYTDKEDPWEIIWLNAHMAMIDGTISYY